MYATLFLSWPKIERKKTLNNALDMLVRAVTDFANNKLIIIIGFNN